MLNRSIRYFILVWVRFTVERFVCPGVEEVVIMIFTEETLTMAFGLVKVQTYLVYCIELDI